MRLLSFQSIRYLGVAALVALLSVGCTRKSPQTSATLTIQLPQARSNRAVAGAKTKLPGTSVPNGTTTTTAPAATMSVQVIIINISASDMTPIFWQWNAGNQSATSTPPTSVPFTVADGSSRLVQVLVVQQDNSGNMIFNYDDKTQDFSGSDVSVDLAPTPIGGATNGQGNIMGRYLSAANTGPTGIFNVTFPPPGGKPHMIVQQGEIFGGFFSTFGLQNVPFDYTMTDGTPIFANLMLAPNASNSLLKPALPMAAAIIYVPQSYRCNNSTGQDGNVCGETGTTVQTNQANLDVVGFFGPGVTAANSMCFDYANNPVAVDSGYVFSDISNPSTPVDMMWQTPISGASGTLAGVIAGGVGIGTTSGASVAACPGMPFQDSLYLPLNNVTNGNSALNFTGPYLATPSQYGGGNYLTFSPSDNGGLTVSWNYLPGATSGISGSEVFFAPQTSTNNNGSWNQPYHISNGNGFYCGDLVAKFGFTSAGRVSTTSAAPNSLTISSLTSATNAEVIVCPYKSSLMSATTYFQSGVDGNPGNMSGGPGGPGGPGFLQLNLVHDPNTPTDNATPSFATIDNTQQASSCKLYDIVLSNNGQPASTAANLVVNLSGNTGGGNLVFYPAGDSTCSTTSVTSVTIPSGTSSAKVFVLAPATGGTAWVNLNGGSANGSSNLYIVPTSYVAPYALTAAFNWNPSTMVLGQCYPIQLTLTGSGQPSYLSTSVGSAQGLSVVATAGAGGTFYTDSSCKTPMDATFVIPANTAGANIYYLPGAVASAATISASATGLSPFPTQSFNVDSPSTYQFVAYLNQMSGGSMQYNGGMWWAPAGCSQVFLEAWTSNFGMIQPPNVVASTPVTLSAVTGSFYTNSTCTAGQSSSTTYSYSSNGGSAVMVYYMNAGGMDTLTTTSLATGSKPMTLNFPPSAIVLQTTGGPSPGLCSGMGCGLGLMVSLRGPNNTPYLMPSAGTINISADGPSSGSYAFGSYPSPSSCSASSFGIIPVGLAVGQTQGVAYVCPSGNTQPANSTNLTAWININGMNVTSNAVTVTPNAGSATGPMAAVVLMSPSGSSQVKAGVCETITAFGVDSVGNWVNNGTGMSVNTTMQLSGSPTNNIYNDAACATAPLAVGGGGLVSSTIPGITYPSTPPYITPFYFKGTVGVSSVMNYSTMISVTPDPGTLTLNPM